LSEKEKQALLFNNHAIDSEETLRYLRNIAYKYAKAGL